MPDSRVLCRKLTDADVEETAAVLAAAFADNPCYAWMHPRVAHRPADLRAFFVRNLRWHRPLDLTWVATHEGRVVGTSTLEPPGGVPGTLSAAARHWLLPTVRRQGLRTFVRTFEADREFRERYLALTGGRPYYHLHAVAVAPDLQGRGAGTMLVDVAMREYEARSRSDGRPIAVSTQRERNLPLYERVGFARRGDQQMGTRRGDAGFRTWFLLREASVGPARAIDARP
ncbi:MAG: GNAT family N-acetyltransferase [Sandaracinus sp.]